MRMQSAVGTCLDVDLFLRAGCLKYVATPVIVVVLCPANCPSPRCRGARSLFCELIVAPDCYEMQSIQFCCLMWQLVKIDWCAQLHL